MGNGLLCGTDNDICRINEYGVSSCCDNYRCVRPAGNFQYKVCIDKNKLLNYDLSKDLNINLSNINIKTPNIEMPNIEFPNISRIKLPNIGSIPIFTKNFWDNMFDVKCDAYKKIELKKKLLEEEEINMEEEDINMEEDIYMEEEHIFK
jgi:hypothetical protein